MTLRERLDAYEKLMRLDKPIGILLLLWPALWGLWMAARTTMRVDLLLIFIVGAVLMRSAGCIVNDYADRNFDPHVARTRDRPLATGRVGTTEALVLAGVLFLIAFILVLFLNRLTIMLAVAAFLFAVTYPYTKRFFPLPQAYLGIAFGISIPMAFAATTGRVPAVAWVMMLANVFWSIAYDTEYAMVDRDDDVKLGLNSSAILLGRYDVPGVMACHAAFLGLMALAGYMQYMGMLYYLGLVLAAGFVYAQYQLIRDRDRDRCFQAFLSNNWLGGAVFGGIVFDKLFWI